MRIRAWMALSILCVLMAAGMAGAKDLWSIKNYLLYYGDWDESSIPQLREYGLVALIPGRYVGNRTEKAGIADIRATGTTVILYESIGEDERTFGGGTPDPGDGRGPVFWDDRLGRIVYEGRGIASYYVDQWNTEGVVSDWSNRYPDGIPDRHSMFGACYVNPNDPAWHAVILARSRMIADLGADGFFLDAPEVADPWHWTGWTAEGIYRVIAKIDSAFPDKILFLNRGLFLFDPNHEEQFRWNPRKHIDIGLFESYYLDNDYLKAYGGNGQYRTSQYFYQNKYDVSPKVNAEFGRPDRPMLFVSLDYANNPNAFPTSYPSIYQTSLRESAVEQGRVHLVSNASVDAMVTAILDHPAPADAAPPKWQNTTVGFKGLSNPPYPFYMVRGWEFSEAELAANPPKPRIGIMKAIPGDGEVTVQWDVAIDQTRPVKYNIYYSSARPFDIASARVVADAQAVMGEDYARRSHTMADDMCPYQFTVTGLANNTTYSFVVRAEDATVNASVPSGGRRGPGGGIEETNTRALEAIPRAGTTWPVVLDGYFSDWNAVPGYVDARGDASAPDLVAAKAIDTDADLFLYIETAGSISLSGLVALFNTDRKSYTGDTANKGADWKLESGQVWRWQSGWVATSASIDSRVAGAQAEIRIRRADLGMNTVGGFQFRIQAKASLDALPGVGAGWIDHIYARPVREGNPPVFRAGTFAAADEGVDGMVRVSWPSATDITGPVTYSVTDGAGRILADPMGVALSGLRDTIALAAGLSNGVATYFVVEARDALGNAALSPSMMAVPTIDRTPPTWNGAAGVLRAVAASGYTKIYFNSAEDAKSPPALYDLFYSTGSNAFSGSRLRNIRPEASDNSSYYYMFRLTGLASGTTYRVGIRAVDRQGNADGNTGYVSVVGQGGALPKTGTVALGPGRDGAGGDGSGGDGGSGGGDTTGTGGGGDTTGTGGGSDTTGTGGGSDTAAALSPATMDGLFGDWQKDPAVHYVGADATGDHTGGVAAEDLTAFWLAYRSGTLFLCWSVASPVTALGWHYSVYLDLDNNAATGYSEGGIGADLLIQSAGEVYRMSGTGWNPSYLGLASASLGRSDARYYELAIPAAMLGTLGSTIRIRPVFGDDAPGYDAMPAIIYRPAIDRNRTVLPMGGSGGGSDTTGTGGGSDTAGAKLAAATMDGLLADWQTDSAVHYVGADPAGDHTGGVATEDLTAFWLAYRNGTLFLCWRVSSPISALNWHHSVYIDLDNSTSTGYSFGGIGADLLVQGAGNVYRMTSNAWTPTALGKGSQALGRSDARYYEMAIPASMLGSIGSTIRIYPYFGTGSSSFDAINAFTYRPGIDRNHAVRPGF